MLSSSLARPAIGVPRCTCSLRSRIWLSSSRTMTTSASAPPRPFLFTALRASRAIMPIAGADTVKFLQGLITNDVAQLSQEPGDRGIYSFVLKADGRFLHDIFIYPASTTSTGSSADFLIDHPAASSADLHKYLKRHILRSKVKLAKPPAEPLQTTPAVMAAWRNPNPAAHEDIERWAEAVKWLDSSARAMRDLRAGPSEERGMGWRWIGHGEGQASLEPPLELFSSVPEAHYHLHALSLAVPNGTGDFAASSLALEHNADAMGAISYRKGCYVGQELTARTKHKGVVRKEGAILRLFREGDEIPSSPLPSPEDGLAHVQPFPNLFPLPPPGSSLVPVTLSSGTSARRARPAGKLGSALPALARPGGTITLGYGVVRSELLDAAAAGSNDEAGGDEAKPVLFEVRPPAEEGQAPAGIGASDAAGVHEATQKEGEVGEGGDGEKWLARAWRRLSAVSATLAPQEDE